MNPNPTQETKASRASKRWHLWGIVVLVGLGAAFGARRILVPAAPRTRERAGVRAVPVTVVATLPSASLDGMPVPPNARGTIVLPGAAGRAVREGGVPVETAVGVRGTRIDAGDFVVEVGSGRYELSWETERSETTPEVKP